MCWLFHYQLRNIGLNSINQINNLQSGVRPETLLFFWAVSCHKSRSFMGTHIVGVCNIQNVYLALKYNGCRYNCLENTQSWVPRQPTQMINWKIITRSSPHKKFVTTSTFINCHFVKHLIVVHSGYLCSPNGNGQMGRLTPDKNKCNWLI